MALNFKPSSSNNNSNQIVTTNTANPTPEAEKVQETFDMSEVKQELTTQIVNSDKIDKITSQIDVSNPNSLVTFGAKVAEEVAKASDQVLNSMSIEQVNDSGQLLNHLTNIMNQFDATELEQPTGIKKFFNNAQKELEKILGKYHTMGEEIDKIYVQLRGYEGEIGQANNKLEIMYNANLNYYNDLLEYILAGEQGVKELDAYIEDFQQQLAQNPNDGNLRMDLSNLQQCRDILDQRVMDLKIAENIAMQSIPMLKTMQFSNLNLIRKINSAFIITMPVFKQSLAQAVMLRRQKIQADALKALDEKTNEMLLKNAQNTAEQSKMIARMASGNSVQIETLEKTWQTIVNGIEETQRIQQEARAKRADDTKRLAALKQDFNNKMNSY
ncbi:MAG: toxic anion resistance protein [Ruminococcus sp.]|nr:toxic anion resistance protein [Ruminococcus sp.]MCD7800507.1 toxic anion resistance protein [Ruminococcus sp.]